LVKFLSASESRRWDSLRLLATIIQIQICVPTDLHYYCCLMSTQKPNIDCIHQ